MSQQSGNEWAGQKGGCGESVRVHRYTMSQQSGNGWAGPGGGCGESVRGTGALVDNNQGTSGQAREEDAASLYGYTGTP